MPRHFFDFVTRVVLAVGLVMVAHREARAYVPPALVGAVMDTASTLSASDKKALELQLAATPDLGHFFFVVKYGACRRSRGTRCQPSLMRLASSRSAAATAFARVAKPDFVSIFDFANPTRPRSSS